MQQLNLALSPLLQTPNLKGRIGGLFHAQKMKCSNLIDTNTPQQMQLKPNTPGVERRIAQEVVSATYALSLLIASKYTFAILSPTPKEKHA